MGQLTFRNDGLSLSWLGGGRRSRRYRRVTLEPSRIATEGTSRAELGFLVHRLRLTVAEVDTDLEPGVVQTQVVLPVAVRSGGLRVSRTRSNNLRKHKHEREQTLYNFYLRSSASFAGPPANLPTR